MDSDLTEPAGYIAIVPLEDPRFGFAFDPDRCWIRCMIYDDRDPEKFEADAKVVESKIFDSIPQAKAFLDSVLAFPTPPILTVFPADRS